MPQWDEFVQVKKILRRRRLKVLVILIHKIHCITFLDNFLVSSIVNFNNLIVHPGTCFCANQSIVFNQPTFAWATRFCPNISTEASICRYPQLTLYSQSHVCVLWRLSVEHDSEAITHAMDCICLTYPLLRSFIPSFCTFERQNLRNFPNSSVSDGTPQTSDREQEEGKRTRKGKEDREREENDLRSVLIGTANNKHLWVIRLCYGVSVAFLP